MFPAAKRFVFFAASAFTLGSLGYVLLGVVVPRGSVFFGLYRMFRYHAAHPFQYIAVVAFVYACLATPCATRAVLLTRWRRAGVISGIMLATILVASVPGGMLWKIHDMQAGFFTRGAVFWNDLFWGAKAGLQVGWLVIILSVPYNLLGLSLGYFVTNFGFKLGAPPSSLDTAPFLRH